MTTQFYQCDETNDCSGKEIICTFTHGSCHIECKTPNSCRNTVMRSQMLNTYQHLAVRCSMNNSCPNATIFDTIRVEGYGSNALESVTVNCLYGSSCQIICDNENTCLNATIKGTYTTEVDVKCNAYQSCHNIDVYCPPSGANYFNCEIHGNSDELYDIHTDFNIYGPNGWADIWFDNYNAYVIGGNFICGGENSWQGFFVGNGTESYSCSIEYGLWDCKDPTSPCTNQVYFADNREYFIIDDDEIDGTYLECKQFDDSVLYPVTMWSACNLICRGDNTCQNVEFACTALSKKQCNVICSGANSCNGLVLNNFSMPTSHPSFSSSDINVLCGNDNACQNSYISPPDKMMSLTTYRVNLFGENNLIGSVVNCSGLYSSATCDIRCQNDLSCKSGTVSTPMFVDIDIQCNGNSNSCSDMTIHCSKYGECRIRGLSVDENTNFHIFSRESWVNVFLDEWYNKSIIGNKNTMHCGIEYGNEYNNTCVIDNNWNCTCLVYPTSTPTDAVIADAVIDKDLYILADKTSEEIEVKAIATFDSSKSGVDGTVQVDENGNVFINLD
eukprot:789564_1